MANVAENSAATEIADEISALVAGITERYGAKLAMAGLVMTSAGFVGHLDRESSQRGNPAYALAAWQRAFSTLYDAMFFYDGSVGPGEAN